jgi:hypothetical protein
MDSAFSPDGKWLTTVAMDSSMFLCALPRLIASHLEHCDSGQPPAAITPAGLEFVASALYVRRVVCRFAVDGSTRTQYTQLHEDGVLAVRHLNSRIWRTCLSDAARLP